MNGPLSLTDDDITRNYIPNSFTIAPYGVVGNKISLTGELMEILFSARSAVFNPHSGSVIDANLLLQGLQIFSRLLSYASW